MPGLEDHNYCRNADDDKKPWCYFGNSEEVVVSWSYCDIPMCEDDSPTDEPELVETTTPSTPTISELVPLQLTLPLYLSIPLDYVGTTACDVERFHASSWSFISMVEVITSLAANRFLFP